MEEFIERLKELKGDVDFANCEDLMGEGYLNSFDIIRIVAMVKEEYDVKIPAVDVIPANFRSAASIWSMVERLLDD